MPENPPNLFAESVNSEDGAKWVASIDGEGRRYAPTIGEAIEQVHEWVCEPGKEESMLDNRRIALMVAGVLDKLDDREL